MSFGYGYPGFVGDYGPSYGTPDPEFEDSLEILADFTSEEEDEFGAYQPSPRGYSPSAAFGRGPGYGPDPDFGARLGGGREPGFGLGGSASGRSGRAPPARSPFGFPAPSGADPRDTRSRRNGLRSGAREEARVPRPTNMWPPHPAEPRVPRPTSSRPPRPAETRAPRPPPAVRLARHGADARAARLPADVRPPRPTNAREPREPGNYGTHPMATSPFSSRRDRAEMLLFVSQPLPPPPPPRRDIFGSGFLASRPPRLRLQGRRCRHCGGVRDPRGCLECGAP